MKEMLYRVTMVYVNSEISTVAKESEIEEVKRMNPPTDTVKIECLNRMSYR